MTSTLVMVTYNRLSLLKQTLQAHLEMTVPFNDIVIVNNCSTDGTYEYLENVIKTHDRVHVLHSKTNAGGAGGFATGMAYALENLNNDWMFIADDDAVPDKEMLEVLYAAYQSLEEKEGVAALCTSVINHGEYDVWHRKRVKKGLFTLHYEKTLHLYQNPFTVDEATFVGLMVKTDAVRKTGLPDKEFFIYYDDTDYCYRLKKYGDILCIPEAKMQHDTRAKQANGVDWRGYYGIRNHLLIVKQYYAYRYYVVLKWLKYLKRASFLSRFLIKSTAEGREMAKTAIRDAKAGKAGVHEKYRP